MFMGADTDSKARRRLSYVYNALLWGLKPKAKADILGTAVRTRRRR